ncbi:MAG TPA: DUF2934 domain-containing protein [Planctomycetota bacterium]|nr:DUF2934 domain-containing protein [Planctomycetota bacterium]
MKSSGDPDRGKFLGQRPAATIVGPEPPRTSRLGAGKATSTADSGPSHAAIARRAYEIFLSRGGGHGSDLEDWLRAERELAEERRRSER